MKGYDKFILFFRRKILHQCNDEILIKLLEKQLKIDNDLDEKSVCAESIFLAALLNLNVEGPVFFNYVLLFEKVITEEIFVKRSSLLRYKLVYTLPNPDDQAGTKYKIIQNCIKELKCNLNKAN